MEKIVPWKDVHTILPRMRGKKTVLVGGCFDLFHYGHLVFLKKAKNRGDVLIVALESDEFIKNHKRSPAHTQRQRAELLVALEIVDCVILLPHFTSDTQYEHLIEVVKPSHIAVTQNDVHLEKKRRQARKFGADLTIVVPYLKKYSSTNLIKSYETFFGN
ncbi:glycerol-3-phosphate cytidylyltransferase [Candidatus Roizmanbacteria bacterium CG09_land_8_20_14_0_10_41_9]|uniref:Glycerol-3-phosphate cytidylyltransferase n=1 Tax=Candidatus Roizmanbacteria bacterium CG09_land_8_20_14_0_10_41_9 TaxID=1974850 RepID=A0A2H0WS62_9BACT|nr:MAG: glycerol-3-phosphate cytidylyltransferase [Candidatus Roizmanbacteria bacterium CG09_land_8_20_14_0_10_41_9]